MICQPSLKRSATLSHWFARMPPGPLDASAAPVGRPILRAARGEEADPDVLTEIDQALAELDEPNCRSSPRADERDHDRRGQP